MVRDIVKDPIFLSQKAKPATAADGAVAQDLLDTLQAHADECVGLAANMIGVNKAVIAVNLGTTHQVLFNPVIVGKQKPYRTEEGCLSLAGVRETERFAVIELTYQDAAGRTKRKVLRGFAAQIVQHEIDHLHGILI